MKRYLMMALVTAGVALPQWLTAQTATQANTTLLGKAVTPARNVVRISHRMLGQPMLYLLGEIEKRDPRFTTEFWNYTAYLPRLVSFTRNQNMITLVDNLPRVPFDTASQVTRKIIAAFPIVGDDGKTIEFDFAKGMEPLARWYMQWEWEGAAPQPHSTILGTTSGRDSLIVNQQFQVSAQGSNISWTLRHWFCTSLAKSTMAPRKPDETGRVGYFTTAPWYSVGNPVAHDYIQRWSLDRPIRFAISSNTPARYRASLIQGVQDWNAAFGRDALQLAEDVPNLSPMDPRVDLAILWSDNDQRGIAYATFSPHPQTGQIVHGDVVVFSGYATHFEKVAALEIPVHTSKTHVPADFASAQVCARDNAELMSVLETHPREEFIQRAFRALIRHEVGHILGLRHNFAGNLGGDMDEEALTVAWQDFLDGASQPPDAPAPASSEMDYLPWTHSALMPAAARYDRAAIQWGYFSPIGSVPLDATPPFCTDQQADTHGVADCMRYDGGQEPLNSLEQQLNQRITHYLQKLLKAAEIPQSGLDRQSPTSTLPSTSRIEKLVTDLRHYQSADYSVRTIHGRYPMERRETAAEILEYYSSIPHWGTPELAITANRLKQMAQYSSTADAYWAEDVLSRLVLGVKKLQSVLDASGDVGQKPAHGTATDFDFGS